MNPPLAHIKILLNSRKDHLLTAHLTDVSRLAESFGEEFESGEWLKTAGLLHDLGKFNPKWQEYLLKCNGEYEQTENIDAELNKKKIEKIGHSAAGAIYCSKIFSENQGRILSYLIAGHHTGLPDWEKLHARLAKEAHHLQEALKGAPPQTILSPPLPEIIPTFIRAENDIHLWIRMMYSCLVDADYLDTEKFMSPERNELRASQKSVAELKIQFDNFMEKKEQDAEFSPINKMRKQILEECREKASLNPGFFSLTVPTGGGKTLSSMAFALEHAMRYNKKRIIVAIPYTSIIEQTAAVYKEIFGADNVIEHHCNLSPEKETVLSQLAAENWDAPVIVTTNVRLFESLFASKSSDCRKLHNIANSVIILDEAQTFPPEFLKPILSVLKSLVGGFKTSIVLCTATQPSLSGKIGSGKAEFTGLDKSEIREIIADTSALFQAFQRTQIKIFGDLNAPPSWEEIASKLREYDQVLCIVSTKKDCLTLHELMPEGTIHLSGHMCAYHRRHVIREIKEKLKKNSPVRVVCTQIIEAGVDIDFPVVFRALSGIDSIAQAAGRCNREGKQTSGTVYVFKSEKSAPSGLLRKAESAAFELYKLNAQKYTELTPETFEIYFRSFYSKINKFDQNEINELLVKNAADNIKIQFRTASNKFKMIDDKNQYPIIVKYHFISDSNKSGNNIEELINKLQQAGPDKYLMREFQGYTVTVFEKTKNEMLENGMITEINGIYVQNSDKLYDSVKGLQISEKLGIDDFIF